MESMIKDSSRRQFLRSSAIAGGGLLLGWRLGGSGDVAAAADRADSSHAFEPNAFIRIAPDNRVTIIVSMAEMGQGVLTAIPQIVAEELDANWDQVHFQIAPVDPVYNNPLFGMQGTGGSASIKAFYEPMRHAGASARHMLLAAAADTWKVPVSQCRSSKGEVIHSDGRRLSYGQLATRAAAMPVPSDAPLKDPADFHIVGRSLARLDSPQKVNGSARFGLDTYVPGMLTAVIAHAPVLGARIASFDASAASAMPGVHKVVQLDQSIAVIADGYWNAHQARAALKIQWQHDDAINLSSPHMRDAMLKLLEQPGLVARNDGDVDAAKPARTLEALYEAPYLAHACMEPMNCTASVTDQGVEIWAPTQAPGVNRQVVAKILGIKPETVQVHQTFLGGGFGRRFAQDFVIAAVLASKAAGAPVKVVYSREDDMKAQFYRPASVLKISAGLDANNQPLSLRARVACSSVGQASGFAAKTGLDPISVEGLASWPYATANVHVEWSQFEPGVGVWFLRSVGNSQNAFFSESFIDELAHAAGQDPYQYRRNLLAKQPRLLAVLDLAASKAGWGTPLPAGRARGIAVCESFDSFVAEVVEASLDASGTPRVHRVVCAVDCGRVVNPEIVRRQVQSAVIFGMSAALYGEITLDQGSVVQNNFNDYPMVRMNEAPPIDVHIIASTEKPTGIGEPGMPPLAPALANALFVATGRRARRLPMHAQDFKA